MSARLHKVKIVVLVVLPLAGTVAAMVLLWNHSFFWKDLLILLGMYMLTTMGVTIGFHRMLTHEGFEAPAWLRFLVLCCGSMAYEGAPAQWAATHIVHHAHSDEEGDPHSPIDGFWHAHFGWLFNLSNFPKPDSVAPRLLADPVVRFVDRWYGIWLVFALVIPFALGGWTGLLWGGAVRIFLTTHITWSVNSVCHTFGRRAFETTDASRNHWIVGLLGFGEGWHNNHHAFPESAFHGLTWWQFDMSATIIRLWERMGLVSHVQRVSKERMEQFRVQAHKRVASIADLKMQLFDALERTEKEACLLVAKSIDESLSSFNEREYRRRLKRIWEIREAASRSTIIKKQHLATYLQEVQEIGRSVRQKVYCVS